MENENSFENKASSYLRSLCGVKPNRRTGSHGNNEATEYFARVVGEYDFALDTTPFDTLDHVKGESLLMDDGGTYPLLTSPYSLGCDLIGEIITVSSVEALAKTQCEGKILLLSGAICREQLMPKNFVFYNPEHHRRTIALLEEKKPAAIITATAGNPEMVGALDPFPLIVDGDFDIPVAYCTENIGQQIGEKLEGEYRLVIDSKRMPSRANNVIASKNPGANQKIVVCAHIDSYEDSPGASDNASGTVVLMLLAEMLSVFRQDMGLELVAFNGEDHYSAGGQMDYLKRYGDALNRIVLAINVDDVGYVKGRSAFSTYGCPQEIEEVVKVVLGSRDGLVRGESWYSGDHMIFVQQGVPALAFTAELMPELMATVTHTLEDRPELVDPKKLVQLAQALRELILNLPAPISGSAAL